MSSFIYSFVHLYIYIYIYIYIFIFIFNSISIKRRLVSSANYSDVEGWQDLQEQGQSLGAQGDAAAVHGMA